MRFQSGCLLVLMLAVPFTAYAEQWRSGDKRTDVVELFTSEGCSSCPPADRWLSSLKDRPGLFEEFIPLAFHVDYWDYIGWKDPYASSAYSQRQRQYERDGQLSQVYTPGIVINSDEWRLWFRGKRDWQKTGEKAGDLVASLNDNRLKVSYEDKGRNRLNVAYLGMGLTTQVRAGENRGKMLAHDFVVLNLTTVPGNGEWQVKLPAKPDAGQQRTALAVWVSADDSQKILQAVGGYIE